MQIFDEVNSLNFKKRGIPFEEYFKLMEIPEEDKRKRIEVARKLKDAIDFLFYLILFYDSVDLIDTDSIKNQFMDRYIQAIIDYVVIDEYIRQHIEDMTDDIISSTIDNIDNAWYTSEDRSIFDAENESNVVLNYEELQEAITMGKTHKTWHTMQDRRVRHTHRYVDGKRIKIEEMFDVGNCQMMMPKDYENGTDEECVNCRCSLSYS